MTRTASPCIGTCVTANGHCTGCARSLKEISEWMFYSDEQRAHIMQRIRQNPTQPEPSTPPAHS